MEPLKVQPPHPQRPREDVIASNVGRSSATARWRGSVIMRPMVRWAAFLLGCKVLVAILLEYRFYFPADFDRAAFLIGREASFVGIYKAAFYVHLAAGPISLVLAFLAIQTAASRSLRARQAHRHLGKSLLLIVVLFLAPSGLVMSRVADSGFYAGLGLATLACLCVSTCVMAAVLARARRMTDHRVWAMRLFLLLVSPLILRVVSGLLSVMGRDTSITYITLCWVSWLAPLMIYEVRLRILDGRQLLVILKRV